MNVRFSNLGRDLDVVFYLGFGATGSQGALTRHAVQNKLYQLRVWVHW